MAFKEEKANFRDAITFSDYSKQFISDEAKIFNTKDAEDASARIDMSAAAAFSLSAKKHGEKGKRIKGFIKEAKAEDARFSDKKNDALPKFIDKTKDRKRHFEKTSYNNVFKSEVESIFKDDAGAEEMAVFTDRKPSVREEVFSDNKFSEAKPQKGARRSATAGRNEPKFIQSQNKSESGAMTGRDNTKVSRNSYSGAKIDAKSTISDKGTPKVEAQKPDIRTAKKEMSKERRSALKKTAAAKALRAKGMVGNDLSSDASTGDALRDGNRGMIRVFTESINPVNHMKGFAAKIMGAIAPHILIVLIVMITSMAVLSVMASAISSIELVSEVIGLDPNDRTMHNTSLSDEEIEKIVEESGAKGKEKKTIEFALSRVGYPYSQDYRTSGTYYDCSSLAYYSWRSAGVDISYGGNYPPTAAAEASLLKNRGTQVSGSSLDIKDMKPGDLIFYGGSDNGRYLGIYHVAVYIGGGKVVEAMNEKYGVVYGTLRTKNIVLVERP